MTSSPALSVIMATYGFAPHLRTAVESILTQSFSDFECIIINNGTQGDARVYLDSLTDPRIHIIHNPQNLGLTKALNQGLARARGAYIARMDDDDISEPERLATQKSYLDSHPEVFLVGTGTTLIDGQGQARGQKHALADIEELRFRQLTLNQYVHSSVLFRRDVFLKEGGYDEDYIYTQDYEAWSRLTHRGFVLTNIDAPLIKYRVHGASTTQGKDTKASSYALAQRTTRANIERYIPIDTKAFDEFCDAFYRDRIASAGALKSVRATWDSLTNTYLARTTLTPEAVSSIKAYAKLQQGRARRWYYRHRYATLFGIATSAKKALKHYL